MCLKSLKWLPTIANKGHFSGYFYSNNEQAIFNILG